MGTMKNIIDGNEAADAYARYMRKARRDGDRLPQRIHRDPEKRALARELNNELDKLAYGYEPSEAVWHENQCVKCGRELDNHKRLVGSTYHKNRGRTDKYVCGEC